MFSALSRPKFCYADEYVRLSTAVQRYFSAFCGATPCFIEFTAMVFYHLQPSFLRWNIQLSIPSVYQTKCATGMSYLDVLLSTFTVPCGFPPHLLSVAEIHPYNWCASYLGSLPYAYPKNATSTDLEPLSQIEFSRISCSSAAKALIPHHSCSHCAPSCAPSC